MDLVEIRKKAKELKDSKDKDSSKGKGKKAARKKVEEKVEEEPLSDDILCGDAEELEKLEPVEKEAFFEESVSGEDIDEDIGVINPEEEEASDFLTRAMHALYQKSLDESESGDIEKEGAAEELEYLCFMLSDEEYAVDIRHLREINNMVRVTEVPKTPPYVLGIISLRGAIIPLFDLRMRLGLEACQYSSKTRILIVSNNDVGMGLVVDRVTEVVKLRKGTLEAPPHLVNAVNADLLEGVGRYDDRLLIIPNLSKVFALN